VPVSENDLVFNLCCLQKRSARKRFRKSILDKWPDCAYCGRSKPSTLDHVLAQSKGGKNKRYNLVGCCGECNLLKSREEKILDWVNQQEIESSPPMLTNWLEYEAIFLPKTA
jgi:5-methylcytosine-specific restriction endonuclease McrA